MVERRRGPGADLVAILTRVGSRQVAAGFALGIGAVVAAGAVPADAGVIEPGTCPAGGGMAGCTVGIGEW